MTEQCKVLTLTGSRPVARIDTVLLHTTVESRMGARFYTDMHGLWGVAIRHESLFGEAHARQQLFPPSNEQASDHLLSLRWRWQLLTRQRVWCFVALY